MGKKLHKTNRGEISIDMFKQAANAMCAGESKCSAAKQFEIDQIAF